MRDKSSAIHYGYDGNDQNTVVVPIYQTTAYEFDSTGFASELFELKRDGNIYTRLKNPTTEVFEKRFAKLERGVDALATASGMGAIFYTVANCAKAGENILVAREVYGGSTTLTSHTIKRFGIETRYFNINNLDELKSLIDNKSRLIFCESISNPSISVADIEKIAQIADEVGLLFAVDNTVASPIICKPITFGADLVVHSTSKYTTGQGLAIGGIIVEAEKAKNKVLNNPRYGHFNKPDESYHGLVYSSLDSPFTARARLSLLRDLGAVQSPFNSWLFIQGLETLPLRMVQHSNSALKIAQFLENHPEVKIVNYPTLKNNPNYNLSQKYFIDGMGSGLLSFIVESKEKAEKIANSTKIFKIVANIGDSKSLITHPASTTHQQLSKEELKKAGVDEGLIRLSIGLEDVRDLIEDLEQALAGV